MPVAGHAGRGGDRRAVIEVGIAHLLPQGDFQVLGEEVSNASVHVKAALGQSLITRAATAEGQFPVSGLKILGLSHCRDHGQCRDDEQSFPQHLYLLLNMWVLPNRTPAWPETN